LQPRQAEVALPLLSWVSNRSFLCEGRRVHTRILRLFSISLVVLGIAGVAAAQERIGDHQQNDQHRSDGRDRRHDRDRDDDRTEHTGQNGTGRDVPEIDPSSALQAAALLTGGLLVIRGRRRASVP
jgi:hypothetical protein